MIASKRGCRSRTAKYNPNLAESTDDLWTLTVSVEYRRNILEVARVVSTEEREKWHQLAISGPRTSDSTYNLDGRIVATMGK